MSRVVAALRVTAQHLREAAVSLVRGWRTSALAVATIVAAVFVLGAVLLASATLQRALGQWGRAAELSVYLRGDVADADRRAVERTLRDSPLVGEVTYVDPQQAVSRFTRQFPDLASLVSGPGAIALPASFDARLRDPRAGQAPVADLASGLARLRGVADVRFDREVIDRLSRVMRVTRLVGYALAAVLALAAALAVLSVVRLSYVARRDEVEILTLVGAPFGAIRGPFIAEGWLQATVGALVAVFALAGAFAAARARYGAEVAAAIGVERVQFLSPTTWVAIVVAAGVLGALAGAAAVQRSIADVT